MAMTSRTALYMKAITLGVVIIYAILFILMNVERHIEMWLFFGIRLTVSVVWLILITAVITWSLLAVVRLLLRHKAQALDSE